MKKIICIFISAFIIIGVLSAMTYSNETENPSLATPTRPTTFPLSRPKIGNAMIAAGAYHTVGLKSDGTVLAIGNNRTGQCDVSDWSNIVEVSAGYDNIIGLKANGTVVAVGKYDNDYGQFDVSDWIGITAISAGYYHTVGLRADGTVIAVGGFDEDDQSTNVSLWADIVAISAGGGHTLGLKNDGTVVAVGDNDFGQCNVSDWTDIVAISAGTNNTVGLKSDGTVVAVGDNNYGKCDVSGWVDIIAVSAGVYQTVGLKTDGTVVFVGPSSGEYFYDSGQCNVSDWTDIVAISSGQLHTIGLKSDGTVVAVGYSESSQCNTQEWALGSVLSQTEKLDTIQVLLNGNLIDFDQPPIIESGRTLVPLRTIFEAMGAEVEWHEEDQSIWAIKPPILLFIILRIGSTEMLITSPHIEDGIIPDGFVYPTAPTRKEVTLDVPPMIVGDRTLVPVRAIAEAFDATVDWDEITQTVIITN